VYEANKVSDVPVAGFAVIWNDAFGAKEPPT
jgi:hypothetical protein